MLSRRKHFLVLFGLVILIFVLVNLVSQVNNILSFLSFLTLSTNTIEALQNSTGKFFLVSSITKDGIINDKNQGFHFISKTTISEETTSYTAAAAATFKKEPNTNTPVLRDIHIVMIGDAMMRYQYLSLVYRLRHGLWFHESSHNFHDLVDEHTFASPFHARTRAEFFFQTNQMLQPMEVCDCYSSTTASDSSSNDDDDDTSLENRYFYDATMNNSIVYLAAFGKQQEQTLVEGRLLPNQTQGQSYWWRWDAFRQRNEMLWRYNNWTDVIHHYLPYLEPRPRYVVLNAGIFYKSDKATNDSNVWSYDTQILLQAMTNKSTHHQFDFVWKTTPIGVYRQQPDVDKDHDQVMCNLLSACLNLSFTDYARADLYRDEFNFKEPVYRVINEQMLDLLRYLPNDYVRMKTDSALSKPTKRANIQSLSISIAKNEASSISITPRADSSEVLRNIHMVMIGDSLMRYQYLSLAYRLRHGVWFHDSMWHYNLMQQGSIKSPFHGRPWGEFLFRTNTILYPYELCDCYRRPRDIVENRYYYDPILNNSVSFLTAFGHAKGAMRGRLLPDQVHQQRNNRSSIFKKEAFHVRGEIAWSYGDWAETILSYIRYLNPRPTHIVMNAGIWPHRFCDSEQSNNGTSSIPADSHPITSLSNETRNLLRAIKMIPDVEFVWRTTTFGKNGKRHTFECDEIMCQLLPICVNVSFTRDVADAKYWDKFHFFEPVYRALNEQLLDRLGHLPQAYVRLNLSSILA